MVCAISLSRMNIFTRILSTPVNVLRRSVSTRNSREQREAGEAVDTTGVARLSDCGAVAVPTVNRCVKLISEAVASMPVLVEGRHEGVFREMTRSTLYRLLRFQPNPDTSAWDFMAEATRRYLLDGVAYIVPVLDDGYSLKSLVLVKGSVGYDRRNRIYTVIDDQLGTSPVKLFEDEIVVVRNARYGNTTGGFASLGDNLVRMAKAGDNESYDRLANGGAPRMLIAPNPQSIQTGAWGTNKENLDEYAEKLDMLWRGHRRVLGGRAGLSAQMLSVTSAELQLQGMREFIVREICRMFGVPPTFVFSDSTSNYKSVEMAYTDLITNTIDPILRCFESEMQHKLIAPDWWSNWRIRFNRMERQGADMTTYANFLTKMLATGAYTPNDIRALNNRPAVPGGDSPLVSANLRPLETETNQNPEINA